MGARQIILLQLATCLDDCCSFSFKNILSNSTPEFDSLTFAACCLTRCSLPYKTRKEAWQRLSGIPITQPYISYVKNISESRLNIPFSTYSSSFLRLSTFGERTLRRRSSHTASLSSNPTISKPSINFFFHTPAACHSTKGSSCTKITECTINLSQSLLAGKWQIKKQKQVLLKMEISACQV